MRIENCHLCSRPIYPSKGITFIRNDSKTFRFCRSKCHKNFKMKRQPRKLKWTKTSRVLRGKEMVVDQNLMLAQFAKVRNGGVVRYDRDLVRRTMEAMERVEEVRARRERVFARRRLGGKKQREERRARDRRTVVEGEHLIAREMQEMERQKIEGGLAEVVQEQAQTTVLGEERMRQKAKRRMLVDGGTEMELD